MPRSWLPQTAGDVDPPERLDGPGKLPAVLEDVAQSQQPAGPLAPAASDRRGEAVDVLVTVDQESHSHRLPSPRMAHRAEPCTIGFGADDRRESRPRPGSAPVGPGPALTSRVMRGRA